MTLSHNTSGCEQVEWDFMFSSQEIKSHGFGTT